MAATSPASTTNTSVYFLERDWQSAARLSLQHFICTARAGFLLHPKINTYITEKTTPTRILDLATGTGIWAVQAARAYPNSVVTGLDLADDQFPPAGTLPKNLSFSKYNFFDPVPESHTGQFDVVHIAFIMAALFKGGRDTVIKHVSQFLKPGGWIQWHEPINDPCLIIDPDTGEQQLDIYSTGFAEKLTGYVSAQAWTAEMPKVLAEKGGFVETDMHLLPLVPELLSLETTLLQWNSEAALSGLVKLFATEEAEQGAREALEGLGAVVKSGKMLHFRITVGIGKKPE